VVYEHQVSFSLPHAVPAMFHMTGSFEEVGLDKFMVNKPLVGH
jgi:hypothetical protein